MKRRTITGVSQKGFQSMVTNDLLPVAAGYLGGNMVVDKLLEKVSPTAAPYGRWVKIALGAFLGVSQKGFTSRLGLGLATAGVTELVGDAINGNIGLLPAGRPSYFVSGLDPMETVNAGAVRVSVD